ncbi:MAG: hypothetical protein HZA10_01535 [Nitrospirae bacterium]|nr:hypothetical protein [Nitrospirota bacterium]
MKGSAFVLFFVLVFSLCLAQGVYAAEWTFMVYLDADNDLESYGVDDFMEMASVGSDANVNIVVQFDRIPGYSTAYGDWKNTQRFLITKNMTPTIANAISNWGDGSGGREVNMADPQTLIDFVKWGMDNYPANNYAVILWNHGGGWRAPELAEKVTKAVCWDDTSGGDSLYSNELQGALQTIEADRVQVTLLGFDACLMGMVEVAYEVKDSAAVMVGSEETEPGDGWPYNTLLADLAAAPAMTASDLATVIVNRYGQSYGPNSDTTQSAIDLSMMNSLSSAVSNFAAAMDSNRSEIATARAASQEYTYPEYIDLYHFAGLVYTGVSDPDIQNAALNVMTALDSTVFAEFHGTPSSNSHGLAIYFPETASSFDTNYNGTVIDFPADTQWDEFLNWFYTYAEPVVTQTITPPAVTTIAPGDLLGAFTVTLTNTTSSNYSFYSTDYTITPDGTTNRRRPALMRLRGNETKTITRQINRPWVNPGTYTYGIQLTNAQGGILDDDSFNFTVTSGLSR